MGKPVKKSDRNKKWFLDRGRTRDRAPASYPERQRFLIVCEGEKTEPNYFRIFAAYLPNHLTKVEVLGEGANTLSLVEMAIKMKTNSESGDYPFDEVWAVFDRDSFPPHDFDNAVNKATANDIKCAWSNEAFELWYILYFEDRNTGMNRTEYKGALTDHLNATYMKNAPDMYQQLALKGDQARAIQRARRLHEDTQASGTPPSQANPCTTVYRLVDRLNDFQPKRVTVDDA